MSGLTTIETACGNYRRQADRATGSVPATERAHGIFSVSSAALKGFFRKISESELAGGHGRWVRVRHRR